MERIGSDSGAVTAHRCEDPFCWRCGDDGYDHDLSRFGANMGKNRCDDCYGLGQSVSPCDCCILDCDTCGGTGQMDKQP